MFTTLDSSFLLKLTINTVSVFALILGCYLQKFILNNTQASTENNRDHAISFLLFGIGVFIVTNLLHSVDISMGFAFGLFAVFSMLRYRTESISVKEMTYLFLVIALSLLSAVSNLNPTELISLHVIIFISALACECMLTSNALYCQKIQYEKIDNIKAKNYPLLLNDLKQRTGLNIKKVEIVDIDFLRDTAQLNVFYLPFVEQDSCSDNHAPVNLIP